jgi:uncharacterized protein (DUF1501 family)
MQPWDSHSNIKDEHRKCASQCDSGLAALIIDLKQRGLLDETLILCTGEFGRTPMSQGDGRDHHNAGFSVWLCGGGIRPGTVYGATDELGYSAVENPIDVHDLHASMLRLLGIDHTQLTVKFQGIDARLTGIAGNPIKEILT